LRPGARRRGARRRVRAVRPGLKDVSKVLTAPRASDDELVAAARVVHLHDVVASLPERRGDRRERLTRAGIPLRRATIRPNLSVWKRTPAENPAGVSVAECR
jgi:hypothetical protein